jgi:predicted dehydrogenase
MNSMRKLGVGVVGAGFWGKNHIRVFSNLDHAKLLAICDTDSHKTRDIGKYQIQSFTNVARAQSRLDL